MSDDPRPRRQRRPSHLETEVDALDGLGHAREPADAEEASDPSSRPPEEASADGPARRKPGRWQHRTDRPEEEDP